MADMGGDVHITGSDLPAWASETTLEKLLDQVEKLAGTSEQQKRILDKSFREIQKTGKASATTGKGIASTKDVGLAKALTTGLAKAGDEALDTAAGFNKLDGPLKGFGKALKESSTGLKVGLAAMGGVFAIFGKGAAIYKTSAETMISLANSGINIEDSFLGINRTLAVTGMSMEQFNEMSTKYARVVGQNGWKAINDLVKSTDKATGGFDKFGLTTADATEYAAEYLEQQRMAGVFRSMNERDQTQALAENMKQLTMYSKVLNVSRDDLQDATREMLGNADLQAELYAIEDPEKRAKAQEAFADTGRVLASFGAEGQEALKLMTDMAASPNPYGSAAYIRLVEAGQVEYANSLLKMGLAAKEGEAYSLQQVKQTFAVTQAMKEEDAAKRLVLGTMRDEAVHRQNFGKSIEESEKKRAADLKRFENEGGDPNNLNAFLDWLGKVNKDTEGVTSIVDSMNQITATFDRGVIEVTTKMVEAFVGDNGIGNMADTAGEKLGAVADFANKWLDDFRESEDPMTLIMTTVMKGLEGIIKVVGAMLVAAIEAGFRLLKGGSQSVSESMRLNADSKHAMLSPDERLAARTPSWAAPGYSVPIDARDTTEHEARLKRRDAGSAGPETLAKIDQYLARQEADQVRAANQRDQLIKHSKVPVNAFSSNQ